MADNQAMEEKLHAIVLGTIKHSDKSNVMTVYTPTRGRMTVIVNVGSAKTARMRNAMLMPLSIIEMAVQIRETRELQMFKNASTLVVYRDLYFNPVKNALGLFIAEFLDHLLRDTVPDRRLWSFIADSLRLLDATRNSVANFHITFLNSLATFVGIAPDTRSYREGAVFDMVAGSYTTIHPGHNAILRGDEARIPCLLDRINYSNMHLWKLSRDNRQRLLEGIIRYYEIHTPGFKPLRSVEVLRQLFD